MMHEYAVVSALFGHIEEEAARHHAARVHRVTVKLGAQSGVDPELFATAFTTFSERTICEGAELVLQSVPVTWVCGQCGASLDRLGVPRCAPCNLPARLASGDEIVLERIEMEVSDV